MKPAKQNQLKHLQLILKRDSFRLYVKILSQLLSGHREHNFLKDLSDALRAKDFRRVMLAADSLSEQQYPDATSHFVANQFSLLIRKYPWPKSILDLKPRDAAVRGFYLSEKRCSLINRKFSLLRIDRSRDRFNKELGIARSWINRVLGTRPNYKAIAKDCDFGPGASLGVHGDATSYFRKVSENEMTVTPGAIHHGFLAISHNYHFLSSFMESGGDSGLICYDLELAFAKYLSRIRVVNNNRISFVPKTAKTFRTIAIEPLLNGFFQKGVDLYMRSRLQKIGIDLSDQGLNQKMAREGSLTDDDDSFVTIDMKSASDSVSIGIIESLLPEDWFRLLKRIRSPNYEMDGKLNAYHKFCSMGNGFCFPLETLVFTSACVAVGCGQPSVDFMVYGDDIIVRRRYASTLILLLKNWGFKVNSEKTFLKGPFRESCGTDWFGGQDVRPFTLDYALDSLQNIFKFLNLTCRNEKASAFFAPVRNMVLDHVPEQFRFHRPLEGEDDSGINPLGSEYMTASSCHFSNGRWKWLELTSRPYLDLSSMDKIGDSPMAISDALRGATSVGFGRYLGLPKVTLRNRTQTKIARKSYASTSNWLPPLRV